VQIQEGEGKDKRGGAGYHGSDTESQVTSKGNNVFVGDLVFFCLQLVEVC
jgi:hypothetical protein